MDLCGVLAFAVLIGAWSTLITIAVKFTPKQIEVKNKNHPSDNRNMTTRIHRRLSPDSPPACIALACADRLPAELARLRNPRANGSLPRRLYHGTRLLSYGIIGAICGAIGQQPLKWFFDSPAVLLPWVLVAVLLIMAFGWIKKFRGRPS
jgi:hypothetical protein